jgi:hypothetical protein
MRLTVIGRVTAGLDAKLKARTNRQKQNVLSEMERSGNRVLETAASLTPFDTGFMLEKLRLERTRGGYNYAVGWRSSDFVGQQNPQTGRAITDFYPVYVVYGTRFMAGRDPLTPALRREEPTLRRGLKRALET